MTAPIQPTPQKVDLRELIRTEFKRCAVDPIYFIRKYCYIQEPIRGRILFDLFQYQENAIHDFEDHLYNIILKGRQIGISTAVAAYALWMMLFHSDRNVLVIATKEKTAKNLITKVRFAFDNLPVWLQVPCVEKNKLSLRFKNGSQIQASTAADDAGRSEALSLLVMDEAAFIKNAKEIWVAALPTLSTGGRAIVISTPNGVGNFFHKTYSDAVQEIEQNIAGDKGKFHPIKLDWRVHPNRDQAWRDKMGELQGPREARQEYDAEFIGSGNTVIDGDLIEFYATMTKDPIDKGALDGNLWIWEHPNYNKQYLVVADVARGDGEDFSAAHVIDIEASAQVAEYKGQLGTTEYGHFLIELATKYNDAVLVVERENVGWAVLQIIIDRGYKNLFYMSKDRQVVEVERNITNRHNQEDKQLVAGFGTSVKTRPLIVSKLDTYMRDKSITIRSKRIIEELRVFIWENGKPQAQSGYNDDLVMSLAISLWVRDTAMRLHQEGIELTRTALNNIHRVGGDVAPVYSNTPSAEVDPYKLQIGNPLTPQHIDLRWLLG
jgi:terminase large subunit-like protein